MLSDDERQRYIKLRDAGRFDEALAIIMDQVHSIKPRPKLKLDPKAEAMKVIMEISERMRAYACTEVELDKLKRYNMEQLAFNDRLKANAPKPSLVQSIKTHPELKADKYWLIGDIGTLLGVPAFTRSQVKILGAALRKEGFSKVRRGGKYFWYRVQSTL